MISLLMSALLAQAMPLAETTHTTNSPDAIVVIGKRLQRIRATTKLDRKTGQWRCRIHRSSDDHALDAAFCRAAIGCAKAETERTALESCLVAKMNALSGSFNE